MYKETLPQWDSIDGKSMAELICVALPRPYGSLVSAIRRHLIVPFLASISRMVSKSHEIAALVVKW